MRRLKSMPLDFPDVASLKRAAEHWKFRDIQVGESEQDYRNALADHVEKRDRIEAHEIRTSVGWDKWDSKQKSECLRRAGIIINF